MDREAASAGDLRRVIGFWGGISIVVGVTIGSGIFRTPGSIARELGDPALILGLWTAFGAISLCGALTLAELATLLPRTGGLYVYLRAAYGDAAAFVFGWLCLLVTTPSATGALATFFADLAAPAVGAEPSEPLRRGIALGALGLLTVANVVGVRVGTGIQNALAMVKVGALLAIIAGALLLAGGSWGHLVRGGPADGPRWGGLAGAAAAIIWTYDGWISIGMVAGEVVAPERRLRRILLVGLASIIALYLGANVAYLYALPVGAIAGEEVVATRLMGSVAGPAGSAVIGLCILASVFGALNGNILTNSRVSYAQARDGLAFAVLGRCHPRWGTPYVAILVQGFAAAGLVLWLRDFEALTTYFVVVAWCALLFAIGAVFVLRRKMPGPRPYSTPGYPWVPLAFLAGTAAGLAAIVGGEIARSNLAPLVGLGIALAGFPVYFLWRRLWRG
jgi:APA family basic amino acid/polyamine antiporter